MHWITWALLSAVFAGMTAVLAKAGVDKADSNVAIAIRTSVVVALSWSIVAFSPGYANLKRIPSTAWLPLLASGLATGLSWLCYFKALQLGPVSKVAPIDKLSVVFVALFAGAFLNEPLTMRTIGGVSLIVAGVLVLTR